MISKGRKLVGVGSDVVVFEEFDLAFLPFVYRGDGNVMEMFAW